MQANLHGSLCKLLLYFRTFMVIEKKRNSAQSPRKYANLTLRFKKIFWGGGTAPFPGPSLCGEGDTPFPHLTLIAPSAPRLGSRLRCSSLAPQLQLLDPPMMDRTTTDYYY